MISKDNIMFGKFFLLGMFGAISVEAFKLYEMMGKLESEKFKAVLSSRVYWVVVVLMALASGFIAWGVHSNSNPDSVSILQVILSGIGARSLAFKPFEIKVAHQSPQLGVGDKKRVSLKDIFG